MDYATHPTNQPTFYSTPISWVCNHNIYVSEDYYNSVLQVFGNVRPDFILTPVLKVINDNGNNEFIQMGPIMQIPGNNIISSRKQCWNSTQKMLYATIMNDGQIEPYSLVQSLTEASKINM